MTRNGILSIASLSLLTLISGCVVMIPSANGQQSTKRADSQVMERGAVAGIAQRVDFLYSIGGDCSLVDLPQTIIKQAPSHGTLSFMQVYEYTNFEPNNVRLPCNRKKSPGIGVFYTSAQDFVGTDHFVVQGIFPGGALNTYEFSVTVFAPSAIVSAAPNKQIVPESSGSASP